MANGPESMTWGMEQVPQSEVVPQASEARQRIAAFRDKAIEGAKEGFVGSVESGRAQEVAARAIDIAAKTAETSLNGLPPGTRMVGKFVGRRLIGRLQEGAHNRLDETLNQAADRIVGPITPDYPQPSFESSRLEFPTPTSLPESGGWGVPLSSATEVGYPGFSSAPMPSLENSGWGASPTSRTEPGITPESGGWSAPIPPGTESNWWTDPNAQPVVEIPLAKKDSLFKRLKGKSTPSAAEAIEPTVEQNGWAIPPAPNNSSAGSWW